MSIIVIGDVMLDKFSYGQVKRLNPEAPAPLLQIDHEEYKLGGAANVAANIKSLGQEVSLIGSLGKDMSGQMFMHECNKIDVHFAPIYTTFPTITKWRFIEKTYHQQMLRADYEEIIQLSDAEKKSMISIIESRKPTLIVISDYIKGTIDADLVSQVLTYANKHNVHVLVDSKPTHMEFFTGVFLIKPNFKEFCEVIGKQIPNEDAEVEIEAKKFVEKYQTNLVVTRGNKGATLMTKEGNAFHLHTEAKQVFDVTGAGDTFIAALAVGISEGMSLQDAVLFGNKASGVAVGKVGTSTVEKSELV